MFSLMSVSLSLYLASLKLFLKLDLKSDFSSFASITIKTKYLNDVFNEIIEIIYIFFHLLQ